jgi:hypothetical protein
MLIGMLLSGASLASEPTQDVAYSTAFSPIFGYGPVYGAVIGSAVFRYPASGSQPDQLIYRQVF